MRFCLLLAFSLALLPLVAVAEDDNPIIKDIRAKLKDPAKPFTIMVTFKVKAGMNAAFEKSAKNAEAGTAKEKGNVSYLFNHDPEQPETYVLYERWKNLDALIEHMKLQHTVDFLKVAGETTDGGPKVKTYFAVE
jgi:quinol monooxygenase YgiN